MSRWLLASLFTLTLVHAETYCFGFLNSHPERKQIPETEANEIQKGHMAHMERMNKAGHLIAAGPMMTQGGPRGIVVYHCKSLDEARAWTALDPAVQNKRLTLDVYRWSAPDGIGVPAGTEYHMVKLPLMVLRRTEKWTGSGPAEILAQHGKRIMTLMAERKIRTAGPFVGEDGQPGLDPIGVIVFGEMSLEEAKAIAEQDPAVQAGYMRVEPHMWFVADEAIPKH